MKAVKVQPNSNEKAYCPKCHHELEMMRASGFAIGSTHEASITLPLQEVAIISTDDHSQFFKRGEFGFCSHCQELVFVYTEYDYRRCANCQHCGQVRYRKGWQGIYGHSSKTEIVEDKGCRWFNVPFGVSNYFGDIDYRQRLDSEAHSACKHIDEERIEHNPQMACFLCKHYRIKDGVNDITGHKHEECDLYCPISTFTDKVSRMIGVCAEFKADYEKYKQYRASFEDMLLPPDGIISIPEFDTRIKAEENK